MISASHVSKRARLACFSRNPPFRRLVGLDAKLMAALQAVLPRRLFQSLLRAAFSG
jgi:hypothetical protein